jgi:hypothetical protein
MFCYKDTQKILISDIYQGKQSLVQNIDNMTQEQSIKIRVQQKPIWPSSFFDCPLFIEA